MLDAEILLVVVVLDETTEILAFPELVAEMLSPPLSLTFLQTVEIISPPLLLAFLDLLSKLLSPPLSLAFLELDTEIRSPPLSLTFVEFVTEILSIPLSLELDAEILPPPLSLAFLEFDTESVCLLLSLVTVELVPETLFPSASRPKAFKLLTASLLGIGISISLTSDLLETLLTGELLVSRVLSILSKNVSVSLLSGESDGLFRRFFLRWKDLFGEGLILEWKRRPSPIALP